MSKNIETILKRYDDKQSALLPLLHLKQTEMGYVDDETVKEVAELLELQVSHVEEVISFYPLLYRKTPAKKIIYICHNMNCSLFGGRDVLKNNLEHFKGKSEEVEFQKVDCLGHCDQAPCAKMATSEEVFTKLTAAELIQKIEGVE